MSAREERSQRLIMITACAAVFGLLLDITWGNVLLGIFLLACLTAFRVSGFQVSLRQHPLSWLLLLFFFLHLFGVAYSANTGNAWFVVEKKMSFLLVPLVVTPALMIFSQAERRNLVHNLSWIIVGSGGWYVVVALLKWQLYHFTLPFHQDYFPPIPYVYYAIYFVLCSLILLNMLSAPGQSNRLAWCSALTLYTLSILMILGSKSGIGAFATGLGVIVWKRISVRRLRWITVAGAAVVMAALLVANPRTLHRFVEMKNNLGMVAEDKLTQTEEFTGLNLRLFFWKTALVEVAKSGDWLFGAGTGDAQDFLDDAYARHNLDRYGYTHFDSHNQWIMTLLEIGIPGILVLAVLFFIAFKKSQIAPELLYFTIVWCVFMLSESVLEANKGIVFFTLMACLLGSLSRKDETVPAA